MNPARPGGPTDSSALAACAQLVAEGDPDRFRSLMAAPLAARGKLLPLYAANLEIARAPWASQEPMVAEMRLQWWVDVIAGLAEGRGRAGHPVTEALLPMLRADPQLAPLLTGIAEARRWDAWREPFHDGAAFREYLDRTSGNLMWGAARVLGAPDPAEDVVRQFAFAAGLANWFLAVPELEARGRIAFVDGRPATLSAMATDALERIRAARKRRHLVPRRAIPALWSGWQARAILTDAARDPARIGEGALARPEAVRRFGLLRRAMFGGW